MKYLFSLGLISILLNSVSASPIASIWGNLPDNSAQSMKRSVYGLYQHLLGYGYDERPESQIYILPSVYRPWTK
ncbi:hypothetical protein ACH3XW_30230 [Acanthocheilonema viteae]